MSSGGGAAIIPGVRPAAAPAGPAAGDGGTGPDHDAVPRRTFVQQVVRDTLTSRMARLGLGWIAIVAFCACLAPVLANSHPILLKTGGRWSSPMLRHLSPADVVLAVTFIAGLALLWTRRVSFGAGLGLIFWVAAVVLVFALPASIVDGLRQEVAGKEKGAPSEVEWSWGDSKAGVIMLIVAAPVVLGIVVLGAFKLPRRAVVVTACCLAPVLVALLIWPVTPPTNVVYERYREMQGAGQVDWVLRTPVPFSPTDRLRDRPGDRLKPPSRSHWVGTDENGADILSRMIHGSRIALSIGFIATGIAVLIGVAVGGVMGYFAGITDLIGMRLMEILQAIPTIVLLIALTAAYGRNLYMMMAIIGLLSWTGYARFVRAEFLKLRKQDFVQAAIASGLPTRLIIFKHILPNALTPVLVSASFGVASAILMEAVISFLGLGLVDEPSWGAMLNQARSGGTGFNWWIAVFPGMLIFLTVFAYNVIGEAVRDALDPKLLKREG